MPILLYDLAAGDDTRFSPYCWRVKMALAHKGLAFETRATHFTQIGAIAAGGFKTVPVLDDGGELVADSTAIAEHLDRRYPERPKLFASTTERAQANFFHEWTAATLNANILPMIVLDLWQRLTAEDQAYFRTSREQRFGRSLEDVQAGREARIEPFRRGLAPLRATLARQAFLGGEKPAYADYIVFGSLQWSRVMSPLRLLAEDDPLLDWMRRCLALHGGIAGRAAGLW